MTGIVKTGTLTDTTQLVGIAGSMAPTTVTLMSGAGTRKIRLASTTFPAGEMFFDATPSATSPGMINVTLLSPMCWVEFTGQVGDRYEVF